MCVCVLLSAFKFHTRLFFREPTWGSKFKNLIPFLFKNEGSEGVFTIHLTALQQFYTRLKMSGAGNVRSSVLSEYYSIKLERELLPYLTLIVPPKFACRIIIQEAKGAVMVRWSKILTGYLTPLDNKPQYCSRRTCLNHTSTSFEQEVLRPQKRQRVRFCPPHKWREREERPRVKGIEGEGGTV